MGLKRLIGNLLKPKELSISTQNIKEVTSQLYAEAEERISKTADSECMPPGGETITMREYFARYVSPYVPQDMQIGEYTKLESEYNGTSLPIEILKIVEEGIGRFEKLKERINEESADSYNNPQISSFRKLVRFFSPSPDYLESELETEKDYVSKFALPLLTKALQEQRFYFIRDVPAYYIKFVEAYRKI